MSFVPCQSTWAKNFILLAERQREATATCNDLVTAAATQSCKGCRRIATGAAMQPHSDLYELRGPPQGHGKTRFFFKKYFLKHYIKFFIFLTGNSFPLLIFPS